MLLVYWKSTIPKIRNTENSKDLEFNPSCYTAYQRFSIVHVGLCAHLDLDITVLVSLIARPQRRRESPTKLYLRMTDTPMSFTVRQLPHLSKSSINVYMYRTYSEAIGYTPAVIDTKGVQR